MHFEHVFKIRQHLLIYDPVQAIRLPTVTTIRIRPGINWKQLTTYIMKKLVPPPPLPNNRYFFHNILATGIT